ncbi:MAG: sugar transferase, partial [Cyanobacteria bacterium P01_A01_bin.135]
SLDELPQLWNVLRGDMSLVGTRPPTPDEVQQYASHHWRRLQVKPGITGEWQTKGRSRISDFEDIVKLDLDYQDKWSIWYDLQLLGKTVWVVMRRDGAY